MFYPTLYKTVVFTLFVAAFTLVEHAVIGLWKGKGLMGGLEEYFAKGPYEFLAGCVIFLVVLIPFFGVKELGRVLGRDKVQDLFFRRRAVQLRRYLPFLTWGAEYSPRTLASDLVAAAQVAGQGTPEHLGAALFAFDRARKKPTVTTL